MPGNSHAQHSEVLTEMIGENWIAHEGMTDATGIASVIQANTEATLALAHEQRTANLIALATLCSANGRKELGEPFIAEAIERLGKSNERSEQ